MNSECIAKGNRGEFGRGYHRARERREGQRFARLVLCNGCSLAMTKGESHEKQVGCDNECASCGIGRRWPRKHSMAVGHGPRVLTLDRDGHLEGVARVPLEEIDTRELL